jgi:hypothetical protein
MQDVGGQYGIYCLSFELALKLSDRKTTKIYKRFIYPALQVEYDSESLSSPIST